MGTDIHGVFQKRELGRWVDVPTKYSFDRHYQLFAVLAGVRNGVGFTGVPTGDSVVPISEPRGLPVDFSIDDKNDHPVASMEMLPDWSRKYAKNQELWMGDHSHSWLSGEEMLAWWQVAPQVTQVGVLSREEYGQWNGWSKPSSYCGGVSGPNVVVVNEREMGSRPDWNYVSVSWRIELRDELAYFFDEVARLVDQHGEIRFVFGFDS